MSCMTYLSALPAAENDSLPTTTLHITVRPWAEVEKCCKTKVSF